MFNLKTTKVMSTVLAAIMGLSILASSNVSEASRRHYDHHPRYERHHDRNADKGYSEGERNTAAIAGLVVGAVIGATVANNS